MNINETESEAQPPQLIVPVEDRPFWDALNAGTFVLARCTCGAYYARSQACLQCGASAQSLTWVPVSGHGIVRTFVVFDKPYHPYFKGRIPYVVAVVTLAEGPELTTNIIDVDVSAVKIGMPVRIVVGERGGNKIPQASARV